MDDSDTSEDAYDFGMPGAFPINTPSTTSLRGNVIQSINTPLRRVPPEVLGNIFTHCLDSYVSLPCISFAPLLLCRINKRCRQVALSTPSLWSSIRLQLPPKSTMECMIMGVQTWLSRSGALPVSIRIDSHPTYALPDD